MWSKAPTFRQSDLGMLLASLRVATFNIESLNWLNLQSHSMMHFGVLGFSTASHWASCIVYILNLQFPSLNPVVGYALLTDNHAIPSAATAKMPPPQGRPGPTRDSGPRSPKSILVAQYSLLLSIGTGTAGVTYFTIAGPEDTVNLVGNAVNIATVIALKLCSKFSID